MQLWNLAQPTVATYLCALKLSVAVYIGTWRPKVLCRVTAARSECSSRLTTPAHSSRDEEAENGRLLWIRRPSRGISSAAGVQCWPCSQLWRRCTPSYAA